MYLSKAVKGACLLSGFILLGGLAGCDSSSGDTAAAAQDPTHAPGQIFNLMYATPQARRDSLTWLNHNWQNNYSPMLLEALPSIPGEATRRAAIAIMEQGTGQAFGPDINAWFKWLWAQEYTAHPGYSWFKTVYYGRVDPRFRRYFREPVNSEIRLDEIRWGGVQQNGIPPLRSPDMLGAQQADYLDDSNVVFAVVINGDARAYPKRILAHHEMFTDEIGGVDITGVYCTLCGAMIAYESAGHRLGTSGFLYRSNKLMFDQATQSLWSTFTGHPVLGELAGSDIFLQRHPVVTTTWGQWRRDHPHGNVLALNTGFERDYAEGAAYREYFATDELMFTVPRADEPLDMPNKTEILALRAGDDRLAITADLLSNHPVYQTRLDGKPLVVITDDSGANRVYAAGDHEFDSLSDEADLVFSADGARWRVTEEALVAADGTSLPRLPAHRAFWFGWQAAFPRTRLVRE